jgi:hypothetical protein
MFTFNPMGQYLPPAHFGYRMRRRGPAPKYHDVTTMTLSFLSDREIIFQYLPESSEVGQEPGWVANTLWRRLSFEFSGRSIMPSIRRRIWMLSFFLIFFLMSWTFGIEPVRAGDPTDQELSALVRQAYIYSFPVYEMYRVRYNAVYNPNNSYRIRLNHFGHGRKLADHTARVVTQPNNDTLYSSAWLDLSEEPLILSVPDTEGRYYSLAFMDFYTNNFAYVGRRVTGTKAGDYVIVGPMWKDSLPPGLRVIKSPTNAVWLLGRTLVDSEEDLPNVHRLQDQYKLTPLAVWNKSEAKKQQTPPKNPPPAPNPKDPWDFFRIINIGLTENPPPADEAPLMAELAKINIGPNQTFDPARFNEEQRKIMLKAMEDTPREMRRSYSPPGRIREGWSYPPPHLGNFGKDYPYRAVVALVGLAALEPAEAYYFEARIDKQGNLLRGENRYRLHFNKGQLPPVEAFWSLTMYEVMPDQRGFFVDNPIRRYSIGDRTKGLKINTDGSLDIYTQRTSPGHDLESNWLPTPDGVFRVTFRAYQPGQAILNGTYVLPGIQRLE